MSGDLTAPETFTSMLTADSIMKRMIPTTVLLFLISALLFSVLRRRRHAGHRLVWTPPTLTPQAA
jgi:preprotein translocase subunit SecG